MGRGTWLTKLDIEAAYRIIPVHPEDRPLLGMVWGGELYLDTALLFGLRSAPKFFNALADGLQWILQEQGIKVIHYLVCFEPQGEKNDLRALEGALSTCARLGVPIAAHKTEGPAHVITFLGIEVDTVAQEVRLPMEKLRRLQREIRSWSSRKSCTKRELLSLVGQLQHAGCVVRPGRTFLRRMISLSTIPKGLHHRVRLNVGFRSDLMWWNAFLESWNGKSMMSGIIKSHYVATITSEASGTWGCGAFSSRGEWFQLEWPDSWRELHITIQELLPIVLSVALWGGQWHDSTVRCRCDNAAVVAIVNKGTVDVTRPCS